MTVDEIISEIDDHGFEDTTSSRKVGVINDAVADACSREPWPFLEATASVSIATDTPTLPTDFRAALALIIPASGAVLLPERLDTITKSYLPQNQGTGVPLFYYFIGEALKVWPAPGATYAATLMYLRDHEVLTALSDESDILIPRRHHRLIVLGALSRLYAMEDDPELAGLFASQFEQRIQTMQNDVWKKQYDRTDRVVDVWDD